MDRSTPGITPLRQRMLEDMHLRKLEPKDAGRLHPLPTQAHRLSAWRLPQRGFAGLLGTATCCGQDKVRTQCRSRPKFRTRVGHGDP
jgi:hypothetical protein